MGEERKYTRYAIYTCSFCAVETLLFRKAYIQFYGDDDGNGDVETGHGHHDENCRFKKTFQCNDYFLDGIE